MGLKFHFTIKRDTQKLFTFTVGDGNFTNINLNFSKHKLKFSVIKVANKSSDSFIILVGMLLESDPFFMSRFFIYLITSVFQISLKENVLF